MSYEEAETCFSLGIKAIAHNTVVIDDPIYSFFDIFFHILEL